MIQPSKIKSALEQLLTHNLGNQNELAMNSLIFGAYEHVAKRLNIGKSSVGLEEPTNIYYINPRNVREMTAIMGASDKVIGAKRPMAESQISVLKKARNETQSSEESNRKSMTSENQTW